MRVRALRACAVVVAVVLAAALGGGFEEASGSGVLRELSELALRGAGEERLGLEALAPATACEPDVPPSFEEELLALEGRADVRADARAGIAGFTVEEPPDQAFSELSSELEAKGWSRVESGAAACGTFAKNEGPYRWAFASCVGSGTATCVVVQVEPIDEEGA